MPEANSKANSFNVIIVGGSYAGLTLAHCLDRAKISYTLLERRESSILSSGYGTAIGANGSRILDQLGLYDDLLSVLGQCNYVSSFDEGEEVPRGLTHDGNLLFKPRFGYHVMVGDRKSILDVLFNRLEDKSRIIFGKHVTEVLHAEDGVTVKCTDGSEFEGDIVVAADGIRSKIRDTMRQHIIKMGDEKAIVKDLQSMTSEYKSLYGVSDVTDKEDEMLMEGEIVRMRKDRIGVFAFLGNPGKVFFFVTWRMPEKYHKDNMPRFDEADIAKLLEPIRDWKVTKKTTIGELVDRVVSPLLLAPISEMNTDIWTWDRFVCCGDSVVKFMPQIGQGANQAMESAAALTNSLHKLLQSNPGTKPSLDSVRQALRGYQNARLGRAHAIGDYSGLITRLMEGATLKERLMDRWLPVIIDDVGTNTTTDLLIGSESLDFLPQPSRVLSTHRGFDYNYGGVGKKESTLKRASHAMCLIIVLLVSLQTTPFLPLLTGDAATAWNYNFHNPFLKYFPIFSQQRAYFVPVLADSDQKLQGMVYASTLLPLLTILWVESIRRANTFKFAEFAPLIFGLFAINKGYSIALPLYCFIHYIQSPLHNLLFQDQRMVKIARVKTLLPTLLIGYTLPTSLAFLPFLPHRTRQLASAISIIHPVVLSVTSYLLSKLVLDTTTHDRIHNPKADLPYLQANYIFAGALSGLVWIFTMITEPRQITHILFTNGNIDMEVFYMSIAGIVWVLLSIHDLKQGGCVMQSWWVILTAMTGGLICGGPGTVLAGAWAFREKALARPLTKKSGIANGPI